MFYFHKILWRSFSPQISTPVAAFLDQKASMGRWPCLQNFSNSSETSPVCQIQKYTQSAAKLYT